MSVGSRDEIFQVSATEGPCFILVVPKTHRETQTYSSESLAICRQSLRKGKLPIMRMKTIRIHRALCHLQCTFIHVVI